MTKDTAQHIMVILRKIVIPILLISLTFALYAQTFQAEFHFDDYAYILESPEIADLSECFNSLLSHFFRPDRMLVTLSFAINYRIHGLELPGYHFLNIFIHGLNGVLVFYLLLHLLSSRFLSDCCYEEKTVIRAVASGVALLFLLHPVAVNSVTYITQRHVLMASFFYLAGFLTYLKGRSTSTNLRLLWFSGCLVCFWGAIHSKPMALTLPFVLVASEVILIQRDKRLWGRLALILLPGIVLFTIVLFVYAYQSGLFSEKALIAGFRSSELWSPWQHLLTESLVFLHYWKILFLPLPLWLSGDHYYQVIETINGKVLAGWLLHLCIAFAAFRAYFFKMRLISFGVIWFYITLVPPYLLLPIQDVMVDYKTYLASFGIMCIAAEGGRSIYQKYGWRPLLFLQGAAAVLCMTLTIQRNQIFMTEESFWTDVIQKYPAEPRPYNNRGLAYHEKGEYLKAISDFEKAISLQPDYSLVHANIGDSYGKLSNDAKAMEHYLRYNQLRPDDANGLVRIANLYARNSNWRVAVKYYNEAVRVDPENITAMYNLGLGYGHLRLYADALSTLRQLIKIDPKHVPGLTSMGAIYYQQGNTAAASEFFEKILTIDPSSADGLYNLAACYVSEGRVIEARKIADRLVSIDPIRGKSLLSRIPPAKAKGF